MNFLSYVESNSVRLPWSGCAIWMGAVTAGGYGRSIIAQRLQGTTIVHRAVFQAINGKVSAKDYVCHSCDTPQCVNPAHLFVGTPSDNAMDRSRKGRSAPRHGSNSGRAQLSEANVAEIRVRLRAQELPGAIAELFGVSYSSVSHIAAGKTWHRQGGANA